MRRRANAAEGHPDPPEVPFPKHDFTGLRHIFWGTLIGANVLVALLPP